MKWLIYPLLCATFLTSCAAQTEKEPETYGAQVGIVNHTSKYIDSATVNGGGGGNMSAWGAGVANICCVMVPKVWYPNMKVLVRWDMPNGSMHIHREKFVEVEKYDKPGSIYLHFFPDDVVRVVVSSSAGWGKNHPIPFTGKPANAPSSK